MANLFFLPQPSFSQSRLLRVAESLHNAALAHPPVSIVAFTVFEIVELQAQIQSIPEAFLPHAHALLSPPPPSPARRREIDSLIVHATGLAPSGFELSLASPCELGRVSSS